MKYGPYDKITTPTSTPNFLARLICLLSIVLVDLGRAWRAGEGGEALVVVGMAILSLPFSLTEFWSAPLFVVELLLLTIEEADLLGEV